MRHNHKNFTRGVTLLLAVLLTSAGLAIALSILAVVLGQIRISQGTRESFAALYSADVGKECAYYYYYRYDPINAVNLGGNFWDPSSPCGGTVTTGNQCIIRCAGKPVTVSYSAAPGATPTDIHTYDFDIQTPSVSGLFWDKSPGVTTHVKIVTQQDLCGAIRTKIFSDGQNKPSGTNLVNRSIYILEGPSCPINP